MHHHFVLRRTVIAKLLEENRCAGTAAGRVDDQVGRQRRPMFVVAVHHLDPRYAAAVGRRREGQHVMVLEDGHVRQVAHASKHMPFQERSALKIEGHRPWSR
jgi:hypothetical protein